MVCYLGELFEAEKKSIMNFLYAHTILVQKNFGVLLVLVTTELESTQLPNKKKHNVPKRASKSKDGKRG